MNEYDIKRLAEIFAIQAEIDGMKAANKEREVQGLSPAYGEAAFVQAAEDLRVAAAKHNDRL